MKSPSATFADWTLVVIDMQEHFCRMPTKKSCTADFNRYLETLYPNGASALTLARVWSHVMEAAPRGNRTTQKLVSTLESTLERLRRTEMEIIHVQHLRAEDKSAITRLPHERLIGKTEDSAVEGSDILHILQTKKVALCGVNLDACVKDSAIGLAKEGYEVCVLLDLSASGRGSNARSNAKAMAEMAAAGVTFQAAEEFIAKAKPQSAANNKNRIKNPAF